MMIVLARDGDLGRAYVMNGWYGYVNDGSYADEEQRLLVEALMKAHEIQVDAMLPADCSWFPNLSEIHGPADATLEGVELYGPDGLIEQASDKVAESFDLIAAEALGS